MKPVPPREVGLSRKAVQSAVTRDAILMSCLHLFAKHGFVSTSVDMIASAAGITKGAVYWHFDSKDALFEAILDLIRTRWQAAVLQPVSATAPAADRLRQLFAGYSRLFGEEPEICCFLQCVLLERDDDYSPRIARVFKQTARAIAGIVDEGKARGELRSDVDSVTVSHAILASIVGATQQHLVNPALTLDALLSEATAMTLARLSSRPVSAPRRAAPARSRSARPLRTV
jgi:AcrR family transcriptional regulator